MWLKSQHLKQNQSHFGAKTRYTQSGQEAAFGIEQRRNTLKSLYLAAAFPYALRGASHGIASRDFVCQSPNQKPQIFLRLCSLRADRPKSPERRDVYGERYTNCRPCDGKGKG